MLLTNPPTAATVALVVAILLVDKVVCEEAVVVAWLVDGPVEARCVSVTSFRRVEETE